MATRWKKNEKRTYDKVVETLPTMSDLKWSEDKYCRYDAYNDKTIMEFKFRKGRKYEDTMIEFSKYNNLKSHSSGRVAIYAVETENKIYLFNLNRLEHNNYDYKWETRDCNKTTEFHSQDFNGMKVPKKVGYIGWNEADVVINRDTGKVRRKRT